MAQTLMTVSNILLVLALVFLLSAAFVFFRMKIPDVIAELSGKSARKSIEQLREDNKKSGVRRFRILDRSGTDKVSVVNQAGSSVSSTEPLPSETLQQSKNVRKPTERLGSETENSQKAAAAEDNPEYLETSYMEEASYEETGLMGEKASSGENPAAEYQETSVMEEESGDPLQDGGREERDTIPLGSGELQILQDIILIHTEETIP